MTEDESEAIKYGHTKLDYNSSPYGDLTENELRVAIAQCNILSKQYQGEVRSAEERLHNTCKLRRELQKQLGKLKKKNHE
jgi:hypothetical protein